MAESSSVNYHKLLKDALKAQRKITPGYGMFPEVDLTDAAEILKRGQAASVIIEELRGRLHITKQKFQQYFGTAAEANTDPGKHRSLILLLKLNKDLATEEYDHIIKNSKEKIFINHLENLENVNIKSASTGEEKNNQSKRTEEKKVTPMMEDLSLEEKATLPSPLTSPTPTTITTKTTKTTKTTTVKAKEKYDQRTTTTK